MIANIKYLVIMNNVYKAQEPNVPIEDGISFRNATTNNYLRHNCGIIRENKCSNDRIFCSDSTFILREKENRYYLFCSNEKFTQYFVAYDCKKMRFIITKNKNKSLFVNEFCNTEGILSIKTNTEYIDNSYSIPLAIYEKLASANIDKQVTSVLDYQALNNIKLLQARQKIQNGQKLKVFFIVSYQAKFGMESVYNAMKKSEYFEPYIYVISAKDKKFGISDQYYEDAYNSYLYFKSSEYNVIFGYNEKDHSLKDLDTFEPDIIFYNNPNISQESSINLQNLNRKYLTCYVPYGMSVVNSFGYQYQHNIINKSWRQFVSNTFNYNKNLIESKYHGDNVVNFGYPKLDVYASAVDSKNIPSKINNNKKIVIIAPHWSCYTAMNIGTFHLYHKTFVYLLDKFSDINFVFKPHPDLMNRILANKSHADLMSYQDYKSYIEYFDSSQNGIYFEHGNYIDIFRESCCMITDCGSFLSEYLPTNKPIIYLVNPNKEKYMEGFNDYGKKILNEQYLAYNENDIFNYFKKIILDGVDEKKETRHELCTNEFQNLGNSGSNIVKYIENVFTNYI